MHTEPNLWALRRWAVGLVIVICAAAPLAAEGMRPEARPVTLATAATPVAEDASARTAAAAVPVASMVASVVAADPAAGPAVAPPVGPTVGPETNLPLPRFVSLKSREGNARRGPSLTHRVDWVFVREGMPLQITAEYENWRRVVDRDGLGGWVHYSLLSGARTVTVDHDMQPLYSRPDEAAPQTALLEAGVIARLGECTADWCWLSAGGFRGWAPKSVLWGVGADEVRD